MLISGHSQQWFGNLWQPQIERSEWWASIGRKSAEPSLSEETKTLIDKILLAIEGDELWSLVRNKDNQWRIELARDRDTGEIVGVATGD